LPFSLTSPYGLGTILAAECIVRQQGEWPVFLIPDIEFSWDALKAQANVSKHGVSFSLGTTIFRDPLALTIYDAEHSADEERWVTIGKAQNGQYLVVVHTCDQAQSNVTCMRIISARAADKSEVRA
jgi:uncharacterized protein